MLWFQFFLCSAPPAAAAYIEKLILIKSHHVYKSFSGWLSYGRKY